MCASSARKKVLQARREREREKRANSTGGQAGKESSKRERTSVCGKHEEDNKKRKEEFIAGERVANPARRKSEKTLQETKKEREGETMRGRERRKERFPN